MVFLVFGFVSGLLRDLRGRFVLLLLSVEIYVRLLFGFIDRFDQNIDRLKDVSKTYVDVVITIEKQLVAIREQL